MKSLAQYSKEASIFGWPQEPIPWTAPEVHIFLDNGNKMFQPFIVTCIRPYRLEKRKKTSNIKQGKHP
jgi:hypothetical protein